ncbi:MAG: 2-amino-4-hydroxy-6-hydroxymethyldihydropteridine diphosphokinase [Sphingomicrobium sp.]
MSHLYAIALGSNRRHVRHGGPGGVVEAAIARLDAEWGLFDASRIRINPAVGGAGREFANAVALIESSLAPAALLAALKAIERDFGRRAGRRWAARVLDLDIVAWSGAPMATRRLTIPHPRLTERDFVLVPLTEIAPDWKVVRGATPRHLAQRLGKRRPAR